VFWEAEIAIFLYKSFVLYKSFTTNFLYNILNHIIKLLLANIWKLASFVLYKSFTTDFN